jgi:DnaJ-class molecular chaperone
MEKETCGTCRGHGEVTCQGCDGTGTRASRDQKGWSSCAGCNGKGKVTCYNCGGSGRS